MKIKRSSLCTAVILFTLAIIFITITECNDKNTGAQPKKSNNVNFRQKLKTSTVARLFNKVVGFTPKLKESMRLQVKISKSVNNDKPLLDERRFRAQFGNTKIKKRKKGRPMIMKIIPRLDDVTKLLDLVLYDADSIKMSAYNKLFYLYNKKKTTGETEKSLIIAMIRSATELIKYYKVLFNYIKVKQALADGLRYSNKCFNIPGAKNECYKWKALLLETYVFRHKFVLTRFTRTWFNGAFARAREVIPDDKMLKFTETKVACEIKLMVENENAFTRNLRIIVKGITKSEQNFDCIRELLKYEREIENVGSYRGEYYYLLGRAYAKQGENQKAIECLAKARLGPILCQKTRHKNKKIQEMYEKLYIFKYGVF